MDNSYGLKSKYCDWIHGGPARIEKWLSELEEPYELMATFLGSPTPPRRNIQPAGLAGLRVPKAEASKERSTRYLSVELRPLSLSPSEKVRDWNYYPQIDPYERKPRHKTKSDRYEYKEQASSVQKKGKRKEKMTWSMMKRKRTLNDSFHASNVPQSRLTLQSELNTGIFQKGKTSSPVKTRELPDLAFSEMKFLSKKSQITHIESATRHAERKDGQHVDRAQNKAADYDTRFTERTGTPRSTEKRSLLLSEAFEPNLQHSPPPRNGRHPPGKYTFGQTKDRHPPNDAGDLHCERKRKRSSSPFSESKFAGSGEIYEYCLKELLSVYPMIQQESPTSTRSIRYWDLDELKSLLEERKRLWDSHHRVITVYDDDPSCERIVKRRRLLHCDPEEFNPRYSEFSTQMVQGTPARYHKNRGLRETAPIPESPPLPSPLLPLSTHRRADLNKQTNQEELHGSPESVAENVELGHFHSSFGRNPRDVTYPVISPNGHLYTPPQYHISTDVDAGVPIYESELSWIDTHYPAHLHGDPPEPEYDQDLLMQYIDAGFLGITPPDLEYIAQQSPLEDINGDMFEEFKEDMLKQGNTVTTILIPDEPRPSIEQPHRPTIEELYSESEEPGGFIGRGQYRARSQSPHFVRPPLPGEVLQIREVEDIRARDPQPGIPRPLSIDRGSHARVDDEIPGFWRENKLY